MPTTRGITSPYCAQLFASRDYVVYVIQPSGQIRNAFLNHNLIEIAFALADGSSGKHRKAWFSPDAATELTFFYTVVKRVDTVAVDHFFHQLVVREKNLNRNSIFFTDSSVPRALISSIYLGANSLQDITI